MLIYVLAALVTLVQVVKTLIALHLVIVHIQTEIVEVKKKILFFFFDLFEQNLGPNTCNCTSGFTGTSCSLFDCSSVSNCNSKGVCSGLFKKKNYFFNYFLKQDQITVLVLPDTRGLVVAFLTALQFLIAVMLEVVLVNYYFFSFILSNFIKFLKGPNNCICFSGYKGSSCSSFDCTSIGTCGTNGYCSGKNKKNFCFTLYNFFLGPNKCTCFSGYAGVNCGSIDCSALSNCSGNGACVGNNFLFFFKKKIRS